MDKDKLEKEIIKLGFLDRRELLVKLLEDKKIEIWDLIIAYEHVLAKKIKKQKTETRLLAGCLATKYQGIKEEYNDARSMLLLDPYMPEEFAKQCMPKVSDEAMKKQEQFLEREMNGK